MHATWMNPKITKPGKTKKAPTVWFHLTTTVQRRQSKQLCRDGLVVARESCEVGRKRDHKRHEELLGVLDMLIILILVIFSLHY